MSDSNLEREKTESFKLGHISQLEDLESELRKRAGRTWADADSRTENEKAKQLKDLAREFGNRAASKREKYEEEYGD